MSGPSFRTPPERVSSPRPMLRPPEIPVSRASSATASRMATPRTSRAFQEPPVLPPLPRTTALPLPAANKKSDKAPKSCEECEEHHKRAWNCVDCDMYFCDVCWAKQGPHKKGKKGRDGFPHEKADPMIVERLKGILTPSIDPGEQQSLHVDDEDAKWFGVSRDHNNQPFLQDYGRYATIMADSTTGTYKLRYPQLVSFIGQTGAGKSTLIKMLIDQQMRHRQSQYAQVVSFASPVVGSTSTENVPTSGDVHLYADPNTYFGQYPMLYADSEGLEGGENLPMSQQYRNIAPIPKEKDKRQSPYDEQRKRTKLAKVARASQREIKWHDSPDQLKRQFAVAEFYPRLLYTFSDVIVFVLRNPKTFEEAVLSKLVKWASSSMEKSLNQPSLPHAIVALNAANMEVDPREWDPEHATKILMSTVAEAIHRDPAYQDLKDYWVSRGKKIHTMKDLLECYYSSITVVRIPAKGRYMKIDEQMDKLHREVYRRCSESFKAKRRSRMLSNSEELNVYLQCAFDHFANYTDRPFNFMDVAFKINPIPQDFGGNILKLAVAMKNSNRWKDPRNIFKELSFMVASCTLLDISRQGFMGPTDTILEKVYLDYCDSALEDFCAIFWPCKFSNNNGKCVNVAERHKKGHQNEKGRIIGAGPYESDFTFEAYEDGWLEHLQTALLDFHNKVQRQLAASPASSELSIVSTLHYDNINAFYQRLGGAQRFISHSACFCCLREIAEHPLPCGHVLCTPCIKGFGRTTDDVPGLYSMVACPLHELSAIFPAPWTVYFKPTLAGVRILSLDGGGIRGIVMLEVLRHVQNELGGRILVQDFFDLIVGTSTGGIIALAIGIKNWSIDYSIAMFTRLVKDAFTPKFGGVKMGTRKYRTKPLEAALKEHFKDTPIFGGEDQDLSTNSRKVAVTASCETGEQAVIFTNYSRADDEQISYRMERPDDPKNELALWEAARATSAAPTFFRPFVNSRTNEGFIDGAVFHNNPVRIANYESKLIWPDVEDCHPDILLSIGTGHNGEDTDGFIDPNRTDLRRHHNRRVLTKQPPTERSRPGNGWKPFPEVQSWISMLFKRVDNILDAESIWRQFRTDVVGNSSPIQAQRYLRVNPRVGLKIPKMDDTRHFNKLFDEVASHLRTRPQMQNRIKTIAYRLVATSFYFEKSGPVREADDHYIVQGTIMCRFPWGSDNLRFLGTYLQKHQLPSFQPYFDIREVNHEHKAQAVRLTPDIISRMITLGSFDLGSIAIPISSPTGIISVNMFLTSDKNKPQPWCGIPISGFPRNLADDEPLRKSSEHRLP